MRFEKWQALGNDYVILEQEAVPFELTPPRVRMLCDAHTGVGADGVLLIGSPGDSGDVADLRIFNPDGSEAELSGNGAREAILYLRRRGWTDRESFSIHTVAGTIHATITGASECRVDMGQAQLTSADFPAGPADGVGELTLSPPGSSAEPGPASRQPPGAAGEDGRTWRFQHVSIGNPQCAIQVNDAAALSALDLDAVGPPIESHPLFPNRTNVSWYTELEAGPPSRIRVRIFERGVGETLSSGTGASGAAVAYLLSEDGSSPEGLSGESHRVSVVLDGGELEVEIDRELHVHLSGWAQAVFEGHLSEEFLGELRQAG